MEFKIFSEQDILNINNKFVIKSKHYIDKLSPFPLHLNTNKWKWENKDFPRIPCLLDFKEWVIKHNLIFFDSVLSTCSEDPELEFINYNKITNLVYDKIQGDFHTLKLEETFDFIIFNQTIEHLYNPFLSMKNLYNHLKKDGYLLLSGFFTADVEELKQLATTIGFTFLENYHKNEWAVIKLRK